VLGQHVKQPAALQSMAGVEGEDSEGGCHLSILQDVRSVAIYKIEELVDDTGLMLHHTHGGKDVLDAGCIAGDI